MTGTRRAQAMVEFALTLPVLLALVLGVVDTGRGAVAATSLSNAAREAARYGAVHQREAGWQSEAETRGRDVALGLDLSRLTLLLTTETAAGDTFVRVQASYGFQPAAPFIGLFASEISLNASVRMLAR